MNLQIESPERLTGQVLIYDNMGQQVLPAQEFRQTGGTQNLRLDVQNLAVGTYHYLLETEKQGRQSGSFIKQ